MNNKNIASFMLFAVKKPKVFVFGKIIFIVIATLLLYLISCVTVIFCHCVHCPRERSWKLKLALVGQLQLKSSEEHADKQPDMRHFRLAVRTEQWSLVDLMKRDVPCSSLSISNCGECLCIVIETMYSLLVFWDQVSC